MYSQAQSPNPIYQYQQQAYGAQANAQQLRGSSTDRSSLAAKQRSSIPDTLDRALQESQVLQQAVGAGGRSSNFQVNYENFYRGSTPTVESRAKYADVRRILDAYERMLQNNPGLSRSQQAQASTNDPNYIKNINQFYAIEEINKQIQNLSENDKQYLKNQEIFWAVEEMRKSFHQNFTGDVARKWGIEVAPKDVKQGGGGGSNARAPADATQDQYQKNMEAFWAIESERQKRIASRQQVQPPYPQLGGPFSQAPPALAQPEVIVRKPFNTDEQRPLSYFVITDTESKVRDQVSHYLATRQIHDYEVYTVPGAALGLTSNKPFTESAQKSLAQTFEFLSQCYRFQEVMVFNSVQSKVTRAVLDKQLQRTEQRDVHVEALNKFKSLFQQKISGISQFKGFLLDARGNPEKIF